MNFLKSKISFLINNIYYLIIILILIFDLFSILIIKSYYYDPFFTIIENKYYCLSDHSVNRYIVKGWVNIGNKYYYFDETTGEMCMNELKVINNEQFIFDNKGVRIINKKRFCFNGIEYDIDKNGKAKCIDN